MSSASIGLRPMLPTDVPLLAAIFQASVEDLTAEDYDDAQRAAWASIADDEEQFAERLAAATTIVATVEGSAVGFISLLGGEKLDLLYVFPRAARNGVASALLNAIERIEYVLNCSLVGSLRLGESGSIYPIYTHSQG